MPLVAPRNFDRLTRRDMSSRRFSVAPVFTLSRCSGVVTGAKRVNKELRSTQQMQKDAQCFWLIRSCFCRYVVESKISDIFVSRKALNVRFSSSKNSFCIKFDQN